MSPPAPLALILGAGKTGRGLAAALCANSGWRFGLVDREPALLERLSAAGGYGLAVLGTSEVRRMVPELVAGIDDQRWIAAAAEARALFTAVFGPNLAALGAPLARALAERRRRGVRAPLDIITFENQTGAALMVRGAIEQAAGAASAAELLDGVGFVEGMVLTTSLGPRAGGDALEVRTQNAFRLPCDADGFAHGPCGIDGLEPLPRFAHQLQRKIYTYNGINAVISYRGAERGHRELADAARDPLIAPVAELAGAEASHGLIAQFGFDPAEQARWAADAVAKFRDLDIPDPIARNAADPARKLARDDRLVGPALLSLAHGRVPEALAQGIASACHYRDQGAPPLIERHGGYSQVLAATAGLAGGHPLVALVERVARARSAAHG